ncbi:MAG TPA: hypothetical protein EYP98_11665, partial [Planctomycetes bacterium]|nr:hypothetical protein [Planctomycetota bacterium]
PRVRPAEAGPRVRPAEVGPGCDDPVVVKRGTVNVAHFAHKANSTCAGGESVVHIATKEWIASLVSSDNFRITASCYECYDQFTAFRGGSENAGATEVPYDSSEGRYVIDAVALLKSGRVSAAFEVYHTHKTDTVKMRALLAATYCNAFEVCAIDLVGANYPTTFESIRPLRCKVCCISAVVTRRDALEQRRARLVLRLGRRWLAPALVALKARRLKYWRRWLMCARWRTVASRARALHARDEAKRFRACTKCSEPVELYTYTYEHNRWTKTRCDHTSTKPGAVYHSTCAPTCPTCHEIQASGKWCACDRATHRPCADCNKWGDRKDMYSQYEESWMCGRCGVECRGCGRRISQTQATCFTCSHRAKRARLGELLNACQCGRKKQPAFAQCYSCYKS